MSEISVSGLSTDLKAGLAFLTRLPIPKAGASGHLAEAAWSFPLIGVLIGSVAALIYWLAFALGLPPLVAALLAIGTSLFVTGALHEDGLADTADGFGGGSTREAKLDIMRDSRNGSYGVLALILSVLIRAAAIASLAEPGLVAPALIAAHAGARAVLPLFMRLVPRARRDGLSADAGEPTQGAALAAILLGAIVLLLCFGLGATIVTSLLLAGVVAAVAWLCLRQIGGQTGDVLGALEQASEVLILLVASVWL